MINALKLFLENLLLLLSDMGLDLINEISKQREFCDGGIILAVVVVVTLFVTKKKKG
jgi:hypothetical protein